MGRIRIHEGCSYDEDDPSNTGITIARNSEIPPKKGNPSMAQRFYRACENLRFVGDGRPNLRRQGRGVFQNIFGRLPKPGEVSKTYEEGKQQEAEQGIE